MAFETINLSDLDLTKIRSVKTTYLKELPDGTLQEVPGEVEVNIAPLNSINNFLSIIDSTFILLLTSPDIKIPKKFTWNDGKTDISNVFTQYNCGCCWIVSATQAINDSVVCNSVIKLTKNPNINPTNLLTCFKKKIHNVKEVMHYTHSSMLRRMVSISKDSITIGVPKIKNVMNHLHQIQEYQCFL